MLDVGDLVLTKNSDYGYKAGTLCEVTSVKSIKKDGIIYIHKLDNNNVLDVDANAVALDHKEVEPLTREKSAEVYERRAQIVEALIPTLQGSAEKYRKKAQLLRKYQNPKEEVAGEFLDIVNNNTDKDAKLKAITQALQGRVKARYL